MTGVMGDIAAAALTKENPVDLGAVQGQGTQNGRSVTHWTYKLFLGSAVVGAVTGVAAAILAMYSVAIAGALLGATNGLAAFYIKRFRTLQSLEDSTSQLAKEVDDLKKTNENLEKLNSGLKELSDQLRQELERAQTRLESQSQEMNASVEKLVESERKLQQFAGIAANIQEKTKQLSEEALAFTQHNQIYGERVDQLVGEVDEVQRHHDRLRELISQSDANTDEYEKMNEEFSRQITVLDHLFQLIKRLFTKTRDRMNALEAQVNELGEVVPQAVQGAQDAEEMQTRMEELQRKYQDDLSKLESTLKDSKRYTKYKNSYKLLKKISDLEMWPQIKQALEASRK